MLVLSTKDGPVSTGPPPPMSLPFLRFRYSDETVALHVGLLVDRELDVAVLDALGGVGVEVERDQLRLAAGRLHRLQRVERDRRPERDDVVDRGSWLSLAWATK